MGKNVSGEYKKITHKDMPLRKKSQRPRSAEPLALDMLIPSRS
jgi:hypothetical protein